MGNKIDRKELFMILSQKFNLTNAFTINDSDIYSYAANSTCIFKAFNDIYYLIYPTKNYSIILYNLFQKQKICEIKNAYPPKSYNVKFHHCFDINHKRDLLLSLSITPYTIKIWNIINFECLLNIENKNMCGNSSCFLNDYNNNIFIITNNGWNKNEKIKIINLDGNIVKEINDSDKYRSNLVDIYYDRKLSNIYIISSNFNCIISYIYSENIKKYHKYYSEKSEGSKKIRIYDKEKVIQLIGAGYDGRIRIWDFHSGKFLYNIKICDKYKYINDFCFYKDNLIVGCDDADRTRVINIKYGVTIVKNFISKDYNASFVKIISYNNKEYLISCDKGSNKAINIWIINS